MTYIGVVVAVNGNPPALADGVSYDIAVSTPTGPVFVAGMVPFHRHPDVVDGKVWARGFSVGNEVEIGVAGTGSQQRWILRTPEPIAFSLCQENT